MRSANHDSIGLIQLLEDTVARRLTASTRAKSLWATGPETIEMAALSRADWLNYLLQLVPVGNMLPVEAKAKYYTQRGALVILNNITRKIFSKPVAGQCVNSMHS